MIDYKKEMPLATVDDWFYDWNWTYDDEWDTNINVHREIVIYDSIKCGKTYYIKSFLAYNHNTFISGQNYNAFIDYNDVYEYKMGTDSVSVINVITERHYVSEYLLNDLEIQLPKELLNEPNISIKFMKIYPSAYAGPPPHTFFDISVSHSDFPIKKTISTLITEFNSWWWHPMYIISIRAPSFYKEYEVKVFDLLNMNKKFSDNLTYYGSENEVIYRIFGRWTETEK